MSEMVRLHVVVLCLLWLGFAQLKPEQLVSDTRGLARQSLNNEIAYFGAQRKYTCTFQVVIRSYNAGGWAMSATAYSANLFSNDAGEIESNINASGQIARSDKVAALVSKAPVGFPTDVFASVLDHSLLEGVHSSEGTKRAVVTFSFRGDPAFVPATYIDRIAHALAGTVSIDASDHLLVLVNGVASQNVTDGKALLLREGTPVLDFRATLFENTYLPARFSAASFKSVARGLGEEARWNEALTRTFGTRQSCQEFHVTTTINPPASSEGMPLPK